MPKRSQPVRRVSTREAVRQAVGSVTGDFRAKDMAGLIVPPVAEGSIRYHLDALVEEGALHRVEPGLYRRRPRTRTEP